MATKTKNNTRKKVQKTLSDLNITLIKRSEEVIEGTVKAGEQYQKLFAKTLKKGEPVISKQVDLVFDTLEGVKDQMSYGRNRLQTLVGWKETTITDWRKDAEKRLKDLRTEAENRVNELRKDAENRIKDLRNKAEDVLEDIQEDIPLFDKKETPKKKAATVKKTVAKKTTPKKAVKKSTPVSKKKMTNLKLIDGVGPKMEKILKTAGIDSIEAMAKSTKTKLQKIIDEAGPRYKMIDPSNWVKQAKGLLK